MSKSPFSASTSKAGVGEICLTNADPSTTILSTITYQYPLKLITSPPLTLELAEDELSRSTIRAHAVFLLSYGGGLVAGDAIELALRTLQTVTVTLANDSCLCYLPDPVQPFRDSVFEQRQVYNLLDDTANLCVCDWVSEGRSAREENWSFHEYISRNEVWSTRRGQPRRLMLRDSVILRETDLASGENASRMHGLGVFGTLVLCGPMFHRLAKHFTEEFKFLQRIGIKQWDVPDPNIKQSLAETVRASRHVLEQNVGLLWTATTTRGFVVVKFGAREVEGVKRWLYSMLKAEGTIEATFGERALMCLR